MIKPKPYCLGQTVVSKPQTKWVTYYVTEKQTVKKNKMVDGVMETYDDEIYVDVPKTVAVTDHVKVAIPVTTECGDLNEAPHRHDNENLWLNDE